MLHWVREGWHKAPKGSIGGFVACIASIEDDRVTGEPKMTTRTKEDCVECESYHFGVPRAPKK